ncbi:MAG: hypothetical protein R2851_07840 [Caldilineaceae bacterium]
MPISTSSFGDERDSRYSEYDHEEMYETETLEFPGVTPAQAETYLKRLGGGVDEKHTRVEGIGWFAVIKRSMTAWPWTSTPTTNCWTTSSAALKSGSTGASAMQTATARVGSNIAFIKYWGVSNAALNIPLNNSISMTLADAYTTTTVAWNRAGSQREDVITLDGRRVDGNAAARLVRHLDLLRD